MPWRWRSLRGWAAASISSDIPFDKSARKAYAPSGGSFPGGASDNRLYYGPRVQFAPSIDEPAQMLLFDPQTSGGLLLAVPAIEAEQRFCRRAAELNQPLWVIGEAHGR
jgi:selenide, water dikinase